MKSKLDLLLILDETLLGSDNNEETEDLATLYHKAYEESKKES